VRHHLLRYVKCTEVADDPNVINFSHFFPHPPGVGLYPVFRDAYLPGRGNCKVLRLTTWADDLLRF
jgi:hypothetical protein